MLCFVVVMQSFIMNSHEVFIHIHQGCFAGTGAIVRLPQCQWSKPDGYGKISPCITTTKHSKAKTVCIFLGIYCTSPNIYLLNFLTHIWVGIYGRLSFEYFGLLNKDVCMFIVARSRKSLATLTLGSSKIKLLTILRLWRYCGPSNYRFNFLLY